MKVNLRDAYKALHKGIFIAINANIFKRSQRKNLTLYTNYREKPETKGIKEIKNR